MGRKPESSLHFLIPSLADAEERNRQHPETFHVPPGDERESLARGDLAQLCVDDKERLWFEVVKVMRVGSKVSYHGRLRSVPVFVKLRMTDKLWFEPRNILKVEKAGTR